MYLLLKMGIFHCYVSLPEGTNLFLQHYTGSHKCNDHPRHDCMFWLSRINVRLGEKMYGDGLKNPAAKSIFKFKMGNNSICQRLEETTWKTKVLRLCALALNPTSHAEKTSCSSTDWVKNRISWNSFWGVSPRNGTAAKPGWECGNMWAQWCELKNLGCEQRLFTVFLVFCEWGGWWPTIRRHFSSLFGIDQISLT